MAWPSALRAEIENLFARLSVPVLVRGWRVYEIQSARRAVDPEYADRRRETERASKARAAARDPEAMRAAWRKAAAARRSRNRHDDRKKIGSVLDGGPDRG